MNPLVILKLLDLAMLGFTAWEKYAANQADNQATADRVSELRRRVLVGELSDEDAVIEIDAMIAEMQSKRRAAFAKLPKPTHSTYQGQE